MVLCLDMDLFFSLLTFYCVLFFITFTLFGFHVRVKISLLLFLFVCLYLFSSLIRFFFLFGSGLLEFLVSVYVRKFYNTLNFEA